MDAIACVPTKTRVSPVAPEGERRLATSGSPAYSGATPPSTALEHKKCPEKEAGGRPPFLKAKQRRQ